MYNDWIRNIYFEFINLNSFICLGILLNNYINYFQVMNIEKSMNKYSFRYINIRSFEGLTAYINEH
jgi:hypothetical protein